MPTVERERKRDAGELPTSELAWISLLKIGYDKPLLSFDILCVCVRDLALWICTGACYIHDRDECWPPGPILCACCPKGIGGLFILRMELRLSRQPNSQLLTVVQQICTNSKLRVPKTSIAAFGVNPATPARLTFMGYFHWLARWYSLHADVDSNRGQ